MDRYKDLVHRLLDGEISPDEEKELLKAMDKDGALRREYDLLRRAVLRVEDARRQPAPASFTEDVMESLPAPELALWKRLTDFLLRQRTLRWNAASAISAAALVLALFIGITYYGIDEEKKFMKADSSRETVVVRFHFRAPDATAVSVAGDFNHWSAESGKMKKKSNGVWTLEVPLEKGTYSYMFVIDDDIWVTDPEAPFFKDDGFGSRNSVIKVTEL